MTLDIRQLAERGARMRLYEAHQEIEAIVRAFPSLKSVAYAPTRIAKKKLLTAKQKKALSLRMKKYWAVRRKEKSWRTKS